MLYCYHSESFPGYIPGTFEMQAAKINEQFALVAQQVTSIDKEIESRLVALQTGVAAVENMLPGVKEQAKKARTVHGYVGSSTSSSSMAGAGLMVRTTAATSENAREVVSSDSSARVHDILSTI
jgi:methyl-accepting chemotaxis protein